MRHVPRHERACSRATDGHFVADLEGDLSGDDPGDLIAVVVQVVETCGAGRQNLLEHHDALVGLVSEEFQVKRTTGRRRIEMFSAAGWYNKALCRVHVRVPHCGTDDR